MTEVEAEGGVRCAATLPRQVSFAEHVTVLLHQLGASQVPLYCDS